jgi:glycosidase
MKGVSNPDGWVRLGFPGGWPSDPQNKFTAAGRTDRENDAFNYVKTVANFRKQSPAITSGKLMQYVPEDWVYTYFRYNDQQTVMVVMNTANEEKNIDLVRFAERTKSFTGARDIVTSDTFNLSGNWKIPPKRILILELIK